MQCILFYFLIDGHLQGKFHFKLLLHCISPNLNFTSLHQACSPINLQVHPSHLQSHSIDMPLFQSYLILIIFHQSTYFLNLSYLFQLNLHLLILLWFYFNPRLAPCFCYHLESLSFWVLLGLFWHNFNQRNILIVLIMFPFHVLLIIESQKFVRIFTQKKNL